MRSSCVGGLRNGKKPERMSPVSTEASATASTVVSVQRPGFKRKRRSIYVDLALFAGCVAIGVWLIVLGATSGSYRWEWYRIPRYLFEIEDGVFYAGPLLEGMWVTIKISFWSFILMVLLGLTTAVLSLSKSILGRAIARTYVELIRNTPLLIQLFIVYFVLAPILGIDRVTAGILCLAAFEGAYAAEIFRAGLAAVPQGQWEAGRCIGLSPYKLYRYVVVPQAAKIVLPPLAGQSVSLVKDSAIVSVIAVYELTTQGRDIIAQTLLTFEVWFVVAALYLTLTISLSTAVAYVERHFRRWHA